MPIRRTVLDAFLHEAKDAADLDDLRRLLDAAAPALGFDYYALVHHVDLSNLPGGAVRLDNYPDKWTSRFISQRYFAEDPVHAACQRATTAFLWSDLPQMIRLSERQRAILSGARRAGLGTGLTVPIHAPGEFVGSCTFVVRSGRTIARDAVPTAHYLGSLAFDAARRLTRQKSGLPPIGVPTLSPRQRDCLILVARGKSDTDIAQLLSLSRETVHEYIESAKQRLGVATRGQAITLALYHGLITYADVL